jgi:thymidylate kinase
MKLRELMLSNEYDAQLTPLAREFISQAIRSIHIEHLILGAQYDYIIQDRGTLSGKAYAESIGHSPEFIDILASKVVSPYSSLGWNIYDHIIILENDVSSGLRMAVDKKEYSSGDAMESKGEAFMHDVQGKMRYYASKQYNTTIINVVGKDRENILDEITKTIGVQ